MKITITLENSRDFGFEIQDRTKTELTYEEKIWLEPISTLKGTRAALDWIIDRNQFIWYCRFDTNKGNCTSYTEVMNWIKSQKIKHFKEISYIILPIFEGKRIIGFHGLLGRCNPMQNKGRLTGYRKNSATIEPATDEIKKFFVDSLSERACEYFATHSHLLSTGMKPKKIIKQRLSEKSRNVLTESRIFGTIGTSIER